jgi:hypothetical protein
MSPLILRTADAIIIGPLRQKSQTRTKALAQPPMDLYKFTN